MASWDGLALGGEGGRERRGGRRFLIMDKGFGGNVEWIGVEGEVVG